MCSIRMLFLFVGVVCSSNLQAQTSPPTLKTVWPTGATQGATVTVVLEGTNLGNATRLLFNGSGLKGSIEKNELVTEKSKEPRRRREVEDPATSNRLTVAITIETGAKLGIYGFRVVTPLGTTNLLPFAVGPLSEVDDCEDNNSSDKAQPVVFPVTVKGRISEPGDVDSFSFQARAGQHLVFEILSSVLGSQLNSLLTLLHQDGRILAENDDFKGRDSLLAYRIEEAGTYVIRVSDAQMGSGDSYHYRLQAGELSYISDVFPLGVQAGRSANLEVTGYNLGKAAGESKQSVKVVGEKPAGQSIEVSVTSSLNTVRVAVGADPEEIEREPNNTDATAQPVSWPVTINGRILGRTPTGRAQGGADEDWFKFSARRGQRLVLDVEAQRLGSNLDSVIEITDSRGKPVVQATARAVAATTVQLDGGMDSKVPEVMVEVGHGLEINDYAMIGNEVVQVWDTPRHPDDFIRFKSHLGLRTSFFDTTPEGHAGGSPVYKVELAPPASKFSPNGLPTFEIPYRNDDGGALHGSDSHLNFVVPVDGTFLVRIRDVRGLEGKGFPYRLTIRPPRPDFALLLGTFVSEGQFLQRRPNPENFNIPPGGRVSIVVTAHRTDGFDGEVEVNLEDLPEGVTASPGLIPPGGDSTVLLAKAKKNLAFEPVPLKIVGRARLAGEVVTRRVDPQKQFSLIAASVSPDIDLEVNTQRVQVVPGGEGQFTVRVNRQKGLDARIPLELRNLPQGVRIVGVGVVGTIVPKEQNEWTIRMRAEAWVKPVRQPFYVIGGIETNSPVPLEHSSDPVELVVVPRQAPSPR